MRKIAFSLLIGWSFIAGATELFTTEGYRATHYRSPTPLEHEHAVLLVPLELKLMLESQRPPVLIDVYRNSWIHGFFTLQEEHYNISGSIWLANCGDGLLSSEWEDYCRTGLIDATKNNFDYPVVFYCRSDCWLGWNAVKRAAYWGYTKLYWLRDGVDAWEQEGFPVEKSLPKAKNKITQ